MQIVQWDQPRRRVTSRGVKKVYGEKIDSPIIFRFKTRDFCVPPHPSSLSLKFVLKGRETYRFSDRVIHLSAGQFMLTTAGEYYASEISSDTEALSIFLPENFASPAVGEINALSNCRTDVNNITPARKAHATHPLSSQSTKSLHEVLQAIQGNRNVSIDKAVKDLAFQTSQSVSPLRPDGPLLNSKVKSSTRNALISRLIDAKIKIEQSNSCKIDLEKLARDAGLSTFYFNRLFREAFGKPPAAYARLNGLSKSAYEISLGGGVSAAARNAGYADLRSFRRALVRIYGNSIAEKVQNETTYS